MILVIGAFFKHSNLKTRSKTSEIISIANKSVMNMVVLLQDDVGRTKAIHRMLLFAALLSAILIICTFYQAIQFQMKQIKTNY